MSVQPLNDLWEAAAGQPYEPTIGKNSQFTVGITLLFAGSAYSVWLLRPDFGAVYMICAVGVYV
ncbi:unnamed protein product, partial [Aureobasidium pullulans]